MTLLDAIKIWSLERNLEKLEDLVAKVKSTDNPIEIVKYTKSIESILKSLKDDVEYYRVVLPAYGEIRLLGRYIQITNKVKEVYENDDKHPGKKVDGIVKKYLEMKEEEKKLKKRIRELIWKDECKEITDKERKELKELKKKYEEVKEFLKKYNPKDFIGDALGYSVVGASIFGALLGIPAMLIGIPLGFALRYLIKRSGEPSDKTIKEYGTSREKILSYVGEIINRLQQ